MKYKSIKGTTLAMLALFMLASCGKVLNPPNTQTVSETYSSATGYYDVLAKIYASLSIGTNNGPSGTSDISTIDGGSQGPLIRSFFNLEELPTDEAYCCWDDNDIHQYHYMQWTSAAIAVRGMYARPIWNITLINQYMQEAAPGQLAANGIKGTDAVTVASSIPEVRFLRAFNYWVMLDLFGKSTFITEANTAGTGYVPTEISRDSLFGYVASELKAAAAGLPTTPVQYGRVCQSTAWSLLARLYLNAGVYTGTPQWDSAVAYSSKVINSGNNYSLNSTPITTNVSGTPTTYSGYGQLFMADNDKCTNEIIWAINCDGLRTQSYGNTTFLVNGPSLGDKPGQYWPGNSGNGWGGYFATSAFANLFPDLSGATDVRAQFTTSAYGTSVAQQAITQPDAINFFAQGLHVAKWINVRSDGGQVQDSLGHTFADIDFPVFRLPEMFLIYAEATLRGAATGNMGTALNYFNDIRTRAGASTFGTITLQNILDERGRELYWEGHRRTDLIRYGLLTTGTYLWPWKGGSQSGTAVDSKYNLYPVPDVALAANPNLTQNPGF